MNTNNRTYALIAGISLVIMALVAGFSFGYVHGSLIVEEESLVTFQNLKISRSLFIAGIGGWLIILVADLLVAGALYLFFKKVNRKISLATALTRIIYTAFLGIAIYNLIAILPLLDLSAEKGAEEVFRHLNSFEKVWSGGLIIFGIHLFGLAYLSLKSEFVPSIFGWLLLFAGICYLGLNSGKILMPGYEDQVESLESILALPMAAGEIGLAIWLIFWGGKERRHKKE